MTPVCECEHAGFRGKLAGSMGYESKMQKAGRRTTVGSGWGKHLGTVSKATALRKP